MLLAVFANWASHMAVYLESCRCLTMWLAALIRPPDNAKPQPQPQAVSPDIDNFSISASPIIVACLAPLTLQ